MPTAWKTLEAREWGFPQIPLKSIADVKGKISTWVPGMAKGPGRYFVVRGDGWELKKALEAGLKGPQIIAHFMQFDTAGVEAWWNDKVFMRRSKKLRDMGIRYLVNPDYSRWSAMPYAVQIHNMYRTMVTARDLAALGFQIVPNYMMFTVALMPLAISAWPQGMPMFFADVMHSMGDQWKKYHEWMGLYGKMLMARNPGMRVLAYGQPKGASVWRQRIGPCELVPARARMIGEVAKRRRQHIASS